MTHPSIELLAPAGGMEQLTAALRYGADAVYVGLAQFGLRAYAENFSEEDLAVAVSMVHARRKKIYVTLNALMMEEDLPPLVETARRLTLMDVDAAIVSDPGAVALLRRDVPQLPLHLSTQASTLNSAAATLWHGMGVQRIVVGRELSLDGIRTLRGKVPESLELEAFIHGAMCIAHSGRCLISATLSGRSGNRGACSQPCRWDWTLKESGDHFEKSLPICEDTHGNYVLSAGDLCMIEHLPDLLDSGLSSLKIEGRMKSAFYVATVVGAYRRALDLCLSDSKGYRRQAEVRAGFVREVQCVSHRPYDTGFYFGPPECPAGTAGFSQGAEFIGVVLGIEGGVAEIEVRNRFFVGDRLECVSPVGVFPFTVTEITHADTGESVPMISRPKSRVRIPVPDSVSVGDFLRGKVRNHQSL